MREPKSADDWLELCRRRRNAAKALLDSRNPDIAWEQIGFAIELVLKAAIMKSTGMNRWPERDEDPDLRTHDLRLLAGRLGIAVRTFDSRDPAAAKWREALAWDRRYGYSVGKVPQKFAQQMYEAAFGSDGVVEWLAKRYRLNI